MVAKDHAERLVLDIERAKYWLSKGAQPTLRVANAFIRWFSKSTSD